MRNRLFPDVMAFRAAVVLMMVACVGWSVRAIGAAPAGGGDAATPAVLRVGPQRDIKMPSAAARLARDGDIVEIDAGVYAADAASWSQSRLTIRAVGGRAHMRADGAHAEGKAIWVIKGNEVLIENIQFSGAAVPDRNGAGVRAEGAGLTIRGSYFHDNENGILSGVNRDSDIVIEHSEFARNGAGDGYTHNIYIGNARSFTLRHSYVHHAVVGHNVKSRALQNFITYNRIMDEADGRSSYLVEFPNGGVAHVVGNVIQQGPAAENNTLVSYGAEGLRNPVNELYIVNNTIVNDRRGDARAIFVRSGATVVRVINNIFAGVAGPPATIGDVRNNATIASTVFVDAKSYDYRLKESASLPRSILPGSANGFDLRPVAEYAHPMRMTPRTGVDFALGALD